jgi:Colicin V production protein
MGLDIALGVMILFGAIRGWFRGFMLQAIQLGGLVGCVYAAGPIRDLVGPQVAPYLKTIDPSLLGRMLWWSSAVVSYIAVVGLGGLAVKLYRRRPYGEPEPNRADQFAGFLLATGKGALVAAFLVGAIDRHVLTYARQLPWAAEQAKTSRALVWNEQYKPADRIWSAPPVQMFVSHVRQMGVDAPRGAGEPKSSEAENAPVQTAASRPPRLDLPTEPVLDARAADFVKKFDEALKQIEQP